MLGSMKRDLDFSSQITWKAQEFIEQAVESEGSHPDLMTIDYSLPIVFVR